jgi:carbon-monoxide dehydrogenase large subunit
MSILGNRVMRVEDPRLLTDGGTYVADIRDPLLEGAAHVAFARSQVAHGVLLGIDVDEARSMPGVLAVLTASDMGLTPMPNPFNPAVATAPLALDRVRFVGEPIAAVIAETAAQAADAAEAVFADIDPLPVVIGVEAALRADTMLYPDVGSNVVMDGTWMGVPAPRDDLFDGCEVVVHGHFVNQRLAPCPLEVRSVACAWGPDGRLHQWSTSQIPHMVRDVLAQIYGGEEKVHVIVPDMGGGFGPKSGMHPEELMMGGLSMAIGRPLRWTETRSESMLGLFHGRGQTHDITIGGTRDGRVQAYRFEITQDAGAVPGFAAIIPVMLTRPMTCGVYDIERVECSARSVVTNTTPVAAYRGAGRPEATAAIERAMDLFAAELGMDAVEVRRRNLIPPFAAERATSIGTLYDCGNYESALNAALDHAGYDDLRAEQAVRRARGDVVQLGIGVSCYVEVTGNSSGGERAEGARVAVAADGAVTVYTGTSPHGQGHDTSWAMIVAEELGVPMGAVTVVHGDTDLVPVGGGTYGSRSAQQGGVAVQQASQELLAQAKELAADVLEADPNDVVLSDGRLHVAGTPAVALSWGELAVHAEKRDLSLDASTRFVASNSTFPFGAHVAVVEVDTETGNVRLARIVACDDAGRILNPLISDGQIHGGIAQGVAQALLEQMVYDADGNPQTSNFADYTFISAAELPMFEIVEHETPTPINPLGAKGIGESGTIGSTPAVQSAVVDALAHLGVRHIEMPATPERVWRAIRDATDT